MCLPWLFSLPADFFSEDSAADAAFLETTSPGELRMSQQIYEIDIRGNEVTEIGVQAAI